MSREPWCVNPLKTLDTRKAVIHVIINKLLSCLNFMI